MVVRRIATPLAVVALLLLVLCSAAQAVPPQPPPPPPLISNGDFEDPLISGAPERTVPTGWSSDYFGGVHLVAAQTWPPASGSQSVELGDDFASSWEMHQDVPAVNGQRYDLSFAFSGDPAVDPLKWGCHADDAIKRLYAEWHGTLVGRFDFDTTGRTTSDMGWTTAHVLVDGAATAARLRFWGGSGDCGPAIDHVVLGAPAAGETSVRLGDPGIIVAGQQATVNATVLGPTVASMPTGTVQFKLDGSPVGDPVVLTNGVADLQLTSYATHDYTLTAVYHPDDAAFQASSVTGAFYVGQARTSTSLFATPDYPIAGQPFGLDAGVYVETPGAGTPTGAIEFSDGAGPIADPVEIDGAGAAGIGPLALDPGVYYLRAAYSGDGNFSSSYSDLRLVVAQIPTSIATSAAPSVVPPGSAYTVTAGIGATVQTDVKPTGTVQFGVGGVPAGEPVTIGADGVAKISLTAPADATTLDLTAAYSGDDMYSAITGRLRVAVRVPATITRPSGTIPRPPGPAAAPRDLSCLAAGRSAKLKPAVRGGELIDVTCNQAAGASVSLRLSLTAARRLGIKAGGALIVARGNRSDRGSAKFAIRVLFTKKYRQRLGHAKRLRLTLNASVIDSLGRRLVLTQPLTLKR
jgi:hypothetical protein